MRQFKFDTKEYEIHHNGGPKGFGNWLFEVAGQQFISSPRNYSDAKEFAKKVATRIVKEDGIHYIKVLP